MPLRPESAVPILSRTPAILDAWLRGLPDEWLRADEGPDTFSAFEVLGHLVHGEEADWIPRVRRIVEHGEGLPFEPFDRFAHRVAYRGMTVGELLDRFRELRAKNLEALRSLELTERDLERLGMHPKLGTVTLGNLIATWAVHDLSHLRQIARVMAKSRTADVGPWAAFFPVLEERKDAQGKR